MMGKRLLAFDPWLIIDSLKARDGKLRALVVRNPLPDDAHVVGHEWGENQSVVFVLESKAWFGDEREYVRPHLSMYTGKDAILAAEEITP